MILQETQPNPTNMILQETQPSHTNMTPRQTMFTTLQVSFHTKIFVFMCNQTFLGDTAKPYEKDSNGW